MSQRTMHIALAALLFAPVAARAQGTLEDYRRSASVSRRLSNLTVGVASAPTWIGNTNEFWYSKTVRGGREFVRVNAATGEKRPAFDQARMAGALNTAGVPSASATNLQFTNFRFVEAGAAIEAEAAGSLWRCALASYQCTKIGVAQNEDAAGGRGGRGSVPNVERGSIVPARSNACVSTTGNEVPLAGRGTGGGRIGGAPGNNNPLTGCISPDGQSVAFIYNYNIAVRPANGAATARTVITLDGSEGDAYQLGSIRWSPDSRKIAGYKQRPGYRRMVHFILSSPTDQLQPKDTSIFYRKPGDVLDLNTPVVVDVASKQAHVVDNALFPNAYQMSSPAWRPDSRHFTFEYNQRGHQVYRIIEVDAANGRARTVISEEPTTFFTYRSIGDQGTQGKKFRFDIDDGREIIWMSERDGWNHLYMFVGATSRVKHQITKGEYVVRAIDSVDVATRQIWFRASGMNPQQDPYFIHYYRINFDGTGLVAYTEGNGTHTLSWSPDRQYYVDTYSRVDMPPVMELRRASDRRMTPLEKGDASAAIAAGLKLPEVFVAKGRDGKTDIWGIIIKPTNFDARKKYAVIENIYAGPHGSHTPKTWSDVPGTQALAELGFIVVQMDGMGTSNRSKAFHDVAWKNLGDAGFPDRILWHKAVGAKYAWYDLSRVGITGGSAGGQNSTGALLFHPEFYKVAVTRAGCHDNRMDKIWWNEHWMGWPIGPHYEASSNAVNAHRLQGKLLLAVGEFDTNVDPSSTMQLVNALINAGKFFDLYFQPNGGHGVGGQLTQRRDDFFVKWLLGVEPPDWNKGVTLGLWIDGTPLKYANSDFDAPDPFYDKGDEAPPYTWW